MTIPLVIDTDTAADDCFALLVGLLHPEADLRAVTMVAGNVGFDQQVENAFLTIGLSGRAGEVPVHLGSRAPLLREWKSASEVHGDGVGGQRRGDDGQVVSDEHAVDALVRLAADYEGLLRIVAIGPLTNIALAVSKDPLFASRVGELVVMGGSLNGRGNVTPAAEYNIYVDPEAADIVARAGFSTLTFVTWDPLSLRDALFGPERIAEIAALDTTLSRFFVTANQATYDFDVAVGVGGSIHCDSLATLIAIDRSVVLDENAYGLAVEIHGEHTRGATVFDWKPDAVKNTQVIERVDGDRFYAHMLALLATEPGMA